MKSLLYTIIAMSFLGGVYSACSQDQFDVELNAVRSRLQAMGHEYHSQADWDGVIGELNRLAKQASENGQTEDLIEVNLLQAMVAADMLGNYEAARSILEASKGKHGQLALPGVRRIYGRLAETYSKMGDDAAVTALIAEFEQSPAYDPEFYSYNGGWGPQDPVKLARPAVLAQDSITVTAMESKRAQAALGVGVAMPDFSGTDSAGRPLGVAAYRGKVVLVDFWVPGWHPWEQALPGLLDTYQYYQPQGFEILGVCVNCDAAELNEKVARTGMKWAQVVGTRELSTQFGVFGESTNFLLDRDGVIIGRNLSGPELVAAIKAAL